MKPILCHLQRRVRRKAKKTFVRMSDPAIVALLRSTDVVISSHHCGFALLLQQDLTTSACNKVQL